MPLSVTWHPLTILFCSLQALILLCQFLIMKLSSCQTLDYVANQIWVSTSILTQEQQVEFKRFTSLKWSSQTTIPAFGSAILTPIIHLFFKMALSIGKRNLAKPFMSPGRPLPERHPLTLQVGILKMIISIWEKNWQEQLSKLTTRKKFRIIC